jgi:hypothetical protein
MHGLQCGEDGVGRDFVIMALGHGIVCFNFCSFLRLIDLESCVSSELCGFVLSPGTSTTVLHFSAPFIFLEIFSPIAVSVRSFQQERVQAMVVHMPTQGPGRCSRIALDGQCPARGYTLELHGNFYPTKSLHMRAVNRHHTCDFSVHLCMGVWQLKHPYPTASRHI